MFLRGTRRLPTVQKRNDSKNSAAFSPRKILKIWRGIPINFKNCAEFYKISRAQKSGKVPTSRYLNLPAEHLIHRLFLTPKLAVLFDAGFYRAHEI